MIGGLLERTASYQLYLVFLKPPPRKVDKIPGNPCHTVFPSIARFVNKFFNFFALISKSLDFNIESKSGIPVIAVSTFIEPSLELEDERFDDAYLSFPKSDNLIGWLNVKRSLFTKRSFNL
jgi:hypothetical protein